MDKITWQYLSGYFDGDGCYLLAAGRDKRESRQSQTMGYRVWPLISINTCDYEVMDLIADFLKKERIVFTKSKKYLSKIHKNWRDSIQIQIASIKSVTKFIDKILPYTIVKREQLEIHKEYLKLLKKKSLRPKTNTMADNFKRKIITKDLFLEQMKLYDKLALAKSRRQGKKKYSYAFFINLLAGR